MEYDLTKGHPFQILLKFTLPVIGGNLFQLFYTLADSVIVGRTLGADSLAAVGSTSIIVYFVLCFIQGFTGGFGIRLGQKYGARDEAGMRSSVAVSWVLSILFAIVITLLCCLLSHPILYWMQTPDSIYDEAYIYMFVVLLGSGATIFYNMISNMLRALGDSRTPLIFLVFSSLLNIVLDIVFIVPMHGGVAGAAWATVLSQLLSALLCLIVGLRKFEVLRVGRADLARFRHDAAAHLRIGFPMGFQMSVMCIGQLAMQAGVNALGASAIAGYTAATKVDQLTVLVNNAFGIAISNYVAQNYGAGLYDRIRQGFRASLIQTEIGNVLMCAIILLGREFVTPLFLDNPTQEIIDYANGYFLAVAPFYLVLGLLLVYRSSVQSMGNSKAPFAACLIELALRIAGTFGLSAVLGYIGICLSSPMAWIGATASLIPVYHRMTKKRG
ncbi:MAG: MATE family efflux transporter [Eubacteriales bacterium]|nr:MATE family efflux transporter [Eubacteriales bacterium]